MSQTHGTEGIVKVDTNTLGEVVSFDIDRSSDLIKTNTPTLGTPDPWATHSAGEKSWSGTLTCVFDFADTAQLALDINATVALELYPLGETTGDIKLSGDAIVNSAPISNSLGDTVQATFSYQGTGALTEAAVS